ncbi:MAG: histidinol-phosphate transaminase [Methylomonas sp.]|nr:histidinol-phosphate transaminase [Methylomonas sp.]PPD20511.1 MAG: histidinol-phosphate transaminase [Methylomonas sp.]PPD26810.1 MAG: histidinol-phosphate transaminase [Methylomonas sp.]PPD38674.1 MAG: histidinol-phosphate transaminase [Methylomonas sp.]PPD40807.1 MAG: histidinol-phosphate transaminase [Methylomonas sp.]
MCPAPSFLVSKPVSINVLRPEVLAMSAYHVADARNYIKLDAMENPYSWPDDVQQAWLTHLKSCPLNRYPDPAATELTAALRDSNAIPDDVGLLLGNGSDEIIQILLMALPPDASVLAPEPGFVMYRQIARSLGLRYRGVPLLPDSFDLDLPAMLDAIETERPSLIFLAYPNNPTGNLFDAAAMQRILTAAPGLVVVDEAYAPFADASFLGQLARYPNLLVMRTVSKLGLAGLRLGFLVGDPVLLAQLDKVRLPYNINCLTQSTATFVLRNPQFLYEQIGWIREQRTEVMTALMALDGIATYPSSANFILFRVLSKSADEVFAALKQQGVLVKNVSPQGGVLQGCLRVTIGRPTENLAFLNALRHAL